MTELETQVAKIQIGDFKQTTAYVYVLAEKMDATDTELYVLCELPLFNPAARADCERISEAIGASLMRSYRKTANDNTFENALAQINEELGKLAGMGKTHWIGKLNALVAAKRGRTLSIATVGKITALLYREENFTTVSEATTAPTPLKTFENFAVGKLRLNDLLLFSTTQLLNNISIDRIKQILNNNDLPRAAGAIVEILRDNAGPEVACGAILALQVRAGQGTDEEIDLSPYVVEPTASGAVKTTAPALLAGLATAPRSVWQSVAGFFTKLMARLRNQPKPDVKKLLSKNKAAVGVVNEQFRKATNQLRPETFRSFSTTKKFFFISAAILLIALVVSLGVTQRYRSDRVKNDTGKTTVAELQKLANDSNAALIYGDETKARELWTELNGQLSELKVDSSLQSSVDEVKKQATDLANKLNKVSTPQVSTLATLSNANQLIVLPNYFATETQRTIVSYNRTTKSVQDSALHTSEPIVASVATKNNLAVIHNGTELFLWNTQTGLLSSAFQDSVPSQEHLAGFALYPTNNRVYMVDTAGSRVVSFLTSDKTISKPVVSVQNVGDLSQASDLAIDGNIYIVVAGGVKKFNSGKQQEFNASLPSALSSNTKAYTESGFQYLYLLDSGNKRIIILNKQGGLVATLVSDQFTNMKDFTVDEKSKFIYILNDSSLLQVKF